MEKEGVDYFSDNKIEAEALKKQLFRIQVPYVLRFAIIWTVFFAIVGIFIQSIKAGEFIFKDFFIKNYVDWFKSFGSFIDNTTYSSIESLIYSILGNWYYFFYTGGLLALIWGLISWIINLEIVLMKRTKVENKTPEKEIMQEQKLLTQIRTSRINEWLDEGLRLLAQGNIEEAELIYENIRREYNPLEDKGKDMYIRIKDFYDEIIKNKN